MNNGWQKRSIGDILQLEYGKPLSESDRKANGRFPVYGANGERDRTDKFYYDKPSIIVGRKGSAGEINLTENRFWPLDVTYFVTFDEHQHDLRFLYYLLTKLELTKLAKGVKPGINRTEVYSQITKVPSLPEQQRIVGILDEAFDGIATVTASAKKNLQNARAVFESHLQSVFAQRGNGWESVRIDDACESIMDCVNKTAPKVEGPTPFKMIRTTNVRNGRVSLDSVNYVTEEVYCIWTRRQVPKRGDVILTREAPMGEVGMLESDDKVFLGQRLVSYRADPTKLDSRFLLYAFDSEDLQGQIHALASGSTVQHMRVPDSKSLLLSLPSLPEQREIVAKLDALREETERLKSIYHRKLGALEELKESLLHKAFAGELTVQRRRSVVIPFPTRIPNITTTDLHAGILAIAYQLHEKNRKQSYFGHVKAEKIAHMIEAHLGIDLERNPIKDAAGPNDYPHLKRVEHRAKKAGFFLFQESQGAGGYRITKYRGFNGLIDRTRLALGDRNSDIDALLELIAPMNTKQAEIFATVYAAWNNLLLDKQPITDEAIVFEARENWHRDKLKIKRTRFFDAIKWMKEHGVIPTGNGKRVESKVRTKK